MHAAASRSRRRPAQRGLSLIEIMIALVIGMVAVIIMMQMLLNSDTAKRITSGGSDAQVTGTIALYNVERDIRSAGYGLNSPGLLGCSIGYAVGGNNVTVPLAPITINHPTIPAGDVSTDTLLVVYGNSRQSSDGDPLTAISTATAYPVTTPSAFRKDDEVTVQLATRPLPCVLQLDKLKAVDEASSVLTLEGGVAARPAGSIAFNLGKLVVRAYAVRDGTLTMCDWRAVNCAAANLVDDRSKWVPVGQNIVAMRAQYGRDTTAIGTPRTGIIGIYDQATPAAIDKAHCAWARVVAVRMALVVRGTAYDKRFFAEKNPEPLPPLPTWIGAIEDKDKTRNPTLLPFDIGSSYKRSTQHADEWRAYRYKTFETTVPLRNTIWQGDPDC